jgi:nucleotide-binding universal stress UspA family protein
MTDEIVVGLDDSPGGQAALRWAADYAVLTGWRLRAVHALSWPFGAGAGGDQHELSMDEIDQAYRDSITSSFQQIQPRPDWQLQLVKGDAGPVLIEQSKAARALVVGNSSHTGLGRLLIGSVGQHCVRRAKCPVVSVPPDDDEPPAETASEH